MKALWLENQTVTFRDDVPMPEPGPGEALIRMRLAGICSTDLEMARGYYPFAGVLGHEFVGEVVKAPDPGWIGARIVGEISIVCRECRHCLAGRSSHCLHRKTLGIKDYDGVFAEYLRLPLENLHRVPESVPDEEAVFTEPLAAALEIHEQIHIYPTDRALVVGAGRLGQLIAQTLALTGCDLRVVARHDYQRQILKDRGIVTVTEDEIGVGEMDLVVDATGAPGGFALARRAVRPRGTLVVKSTYADDLTVDFSSLVVDEVRVIGSRCGPFAPALRLLENDQVDPTPLIMGRYPLSEGLTALEHAAKPGVFKILLQPDD